MIDSRFIKTIWLEMIIQRVKLAEFYKIQQKTFLIFVSMKSRLCIQIIMIFKALAISSFDRHLAYYCPGNIAQMITNETIFLFWFSTII